MDSAEAKGIAVALNWSHEDIRASDLHIRTVQGTVRNGNLTLEGSMKAIFSVLATLCLSVALLAAEGPPLGKGPHGGELLKAVSGMFHVEWLQDTSTGKATLYVLEKDAVTEFPVKDAPWLVLKEPSCDSCDLRLEMKTASKSDSAAWFEATHAFLKSPPRGRIHVTLNGVRHEVLFIEKKKVATSPVATPETVPSGGRDSVSKP